MLSSGANVIIWDKMLSSKANVIMVSSGVNAIIWCYHVMLSSGMITHPFFYFSWKLHSLPTMLHNRNRFLHRMLHHIMWYVTQSQWHKKLTLVMMCIMSEQVLYYYKAVKTSINMGSWLYLPYVIVFSLVFPKRWRSLLYSICFNFLYFKYQALSCAVWSLQYLWNKRVGSQP